MLMVILLPKATTGLGKTELSVYRNNHVALYGKVRFVLSLEGWVELGQLESKRAFGVGE